MVLRGCDLIRENIWPSPLGTCWPYTFCLGPPDLRGWRSGYQLFSVVYFSRGTLPTKKGVRKGSTNKLLPAILIVRRHVIARTNKQSGEKEDEKKRRLDTYSKQL